MPVFILRSRMGIRYRIDRDLVRIGRAEDNTIVLRDPTVSRYHLNLYNKGSHLVIEDAGSQNGFLINGQAPVGPTIVKYGDIVFFAGVEYRVEPEVSHVHGQGNVVRETPATGFSAIPNRVKVYGAAAVLLAAVIMNGKKQEASRGPASSNTNQVNEDAPTTPLPAQSYKDGAYIAKSISEINAEGKFREGMRDYYNKNYSRAIIAFEQAVSLDPSHLQASHYIQLSQEQLKKQIDEYLKDAYQSYEAAQYRRAKSQAGQVLTILSEQAVGFSRRVASQGSSFSLRTEGQELILLGLPCDITRLDDVCKKAKDVIEAARRKLGEEDTLRK